MRYNHCCRRRHTRVVGDKTLTRYHGGYPEDRRMYCGLFIIFLGTYTEYVGHVGWSPSYHEFLWCNITLIQIEFYPYLFVKPKKPPRNIKFFVENIWFCTRNHLVYTK